MSIERIVKLGLQKTTVNLINIYQGHVRAILPSVCRFAPSCSEYSKQAIVRYGFFKGAFKGIKRLLLCHPLSQKFGYDPLQ